jgi:uncharacterized protein
METTATRRVYLCDSCGACCNGSLIVEASALDVLREPRIDTVAPIPRRHVALHVLDACWVLAAIKPCPFLQADQKCGIYATRPDACVSFTAGSRQCQEARRGAGLRPLELTPVAPTIESEILAALASEPD